jgi:hypothetical protein
MREFREYFASTYEANNKLAARIGVRVRTFADWLAGEVFGSLLNSASAINEAARAWH